MKEHTDSEKGFLKDRLADYRVDPPEKAWSLISGQLGRDSRKKWWLVVLPAAASIALAVTLGIVLRSPDNSERAQEMQTGEPREKYLPIEEQSRVANVTEHPGQIEPPGAKRSSVADVTEHPGQIEPPGAGMSGLADESERQPNTDPTGGKVAGEGAVRMAEMVTAGAVSPAGSGSLDRAGLELYHPVEGPEEKEITREEILAAIREGENKSEGSGTGDPAPEKGVLIQEKENVSATGQETLPGLVPEEESREKSRKWSLAAVLSPQYSYRDAENQAVSGIPVQEAGMLTYAGGINVSYSPVSRLAVESGVLFNRMGIGINAAKVSNAEAFYNWAPIDQLDAIPKMISVSNTVGNIVTRSGEVYVNNYMLNSRNAFRNNYSTVSTDQKVRQQLDYLEVPFNLRYTLIDRDLEVQLIGGVSTNLLLNSHVIIETASGRSESGYLTNIRSMNYTGNAGVGMVYHIAGNFNLRLEPRFRYFLNSVNDSSLPATRPYAFGLFTGLSFLF
jgi:hypothetical protein